MLAPLAPPPCALRFTAVSSSPCTQRSQSEQLCLCLWQVEILCAPVVTQQCSLPPTSRSWKLTQLLAERQGKKGDVCPQYLSPSYACMGFCFDFHLALISPPPPQPPLRILCYFLCVLASQRYERDFGPPHTTLYHTGIPLCFLTPLKHFPPLSLRRHFAFLDVCPSISLWRMKAKLWPLLPLVYTCFWPEPQVNTAAPSMLPPSGNSGGKHKNYIATN